MVHRQNYVAKAEQDKKNRLFACLVSDRFPGVSSMVINMTYYQKVSNPVLMVRTVNVFPNAYAYFNMECMIKGCVNGGFDLTLVIANMIKKHKKAGKGRLVCHGEIDSIASEHASISYEISIDYKKRSVKI